MTLAERRSPRSLTPDPFSASATLIALDVEAGLREKAFLSGIQEHLGRDSQGLETFFGTVFSLSKSEVPPCPKFVRDFERAQGIKIEDGGKKIIVPGRYPLLVPNIPAEQLARVSGVDTAFIEGTRSALRNSVWALAELDLSPSYPETEKTDSDGLFPFAFDGRVYAAYRAFMMRATGEHPDKKTRTILDRTYIGGSLFPQVEARGGKLEVITGLDPNIAGENKGWRVAWTARGDLTSG